MKKQNRFIDKLVAVRYSFLSAIASGLTAILVFLGVFANLDTVAIAAPVNQSPLIAISSSITKQIEGKAEQGIGTVQRRVGEATGSAQGLGNQVQGRVKEELGKVQGSLEKTQKKVARRANRDINKTQAALDKANEKAEKAFQ